MGYLDRTRDRGAVVFLAWQCIRFDLVRKRPLLFSELKDNNNHMGIVTAGENRRAHETSTCPLVREEWLTAPMCRPMGSRCFWWK